MPTVYQYFMLCCPSPLPPSPPPTPPPPNQAGGSTSSDTKRTKSQSSEGDAAGLPNVAEYYKSNTVSGQGPPREAAGDEAYTVGTAHCSVRE